MARAARLLQLMQILRRHRYPVSGAVLAAELGASLRSLYRDIATLQESGATIDGGAALAARTGLPAAARVPAAADDAERR